MRKIIIIGFPHCGTSILKSLIGHIDTVEEIVSETDKIEKESEKEFVLCKWPSADIKFFGELYEDYTKIFIIRNPLWVFSSLNLRHQSTHVIDYKFPSTVYDYVETAKKFIYFRENPVDNIYTIKYEEIFENNHEKLKNILDSIGLRYDDSIFDNTKFQNRITNGPISITKSKPSITDHLRYRTYQINQPLSSLNDPAKISLHPDQYLFFISDPTINKLYNCRI